jgi:hypothetical protein
METIQDTDSFCEDVALLMEAELWSRALVLIDQGLAANVTDRVLRANRSVCKYHLGFGAELGAEVTYLLGDWPRGLVRRSLMVLGILCTHEAGQVELRDRLVIELAEELAGGEFDVLDLPSVPMFVLENRVDGIYLLVTFSGIIEEVNHCLVQGGSDTTALEGLASMVRERERLNEMSDDEGDNEGACMSGEQLIAEGRLLQVLGSLMEEYADASKPAACLAESPGELRYHLLKNIGFKSIYAAEGTIEKLLIHIWNYEVPLPGFRQGTKGHQQSMEDWYHHALAAAKRYNSKEKSDLPEPIYLINFGTFGAVVARC